MSQFIRRAVQRDLSQLLTIEEQCFTTDRLSKRSFKHHLVSKHSVLLVAYEHNSSILTGYALVLLLKGTRLARLYSIAVATSARGNRLGQQLLVASEQAASSAGRLFMRLEVATSNTHAINLYQQQGYRTFGQYLDYYDDHQDALRMQKTIRNKSMVVQHATAPWYQQSTDFTCGPAALMMAMATIDQKMKCEQGLELNLWRESTTIFMTSGLGGTHPFGLALAASRRQFNTEVYVNNSQPLFIDGVRKNTKKEIMTLVHEQFAQACLEQQISIQYCDVNQQMIANWLTQGKAVLMLISTYRLDGAKAPHWVMITGIDEHCLYVHDSHVDTKWQQAIDCQHTPIARADFDKMSTFGASRLRCAIVLEQ